MSNGSPILSAEERADRCHQTLEPEMVKNHEIPLNSSGKKRFLVVSPHPDDADLGMGGTILSLKEKGHYVAIVDLTSGEPTPYGNEQKRKKETGEATKILGVNKRINLTLPNRYLFDSKEARLLLAGKIRLIRPHIIFCPHHEDAHPDHWTATSITEGARFYAKYTKLSLEGEPWYADYLFHYSCSHLRKIPNMSFLVDISDQYQNKTMAMQCYRSQFIDNPKNRSVFDWVEARDRYFGSLIKKKYAEPFFCKEALGVADPAIFLL
jgi:bacillithiol biosynthesis deacetylase BshB1